MHLCHMTFTVYPDSWIRDLPLLPFGQGEYVANPSTIGTNIVLNKGHSSPALLALERAQETVIEPSMPVWMMQS
jgi:hypothetical protein